MVCYITTNNFTSEFFCLWCEFVTSQQIVSMKTFTQQQWAVGAALGLAVGLFILGLHMAFLSAITLFRVWPYYLLPSPQVVMISSVLIVLLHKYAALGLLWIAAKLHRIFSSLLLIVALGADGLLHVLSIPHMEGWWLSLLGSSALITALSVWVQKHKSYFGLRDK
jgi:hypothetical protein